MKLEISPKYFPKIGKYQIFIKLHPVGSYHAEGLAYTNGHDEDSSNFFFFLLF
jgi:hypothetical protein